MQTETMPVAGEATDTFPINGTDYVEFYVGNAKQAAHYYRTAFGFQLVAYRGPETGIRDRASYLLQQNKVRLVLTSAARARPPDRRARAAARRRRPRHRALGGRRAGGVRARGGAGRQAGGRADGAAGRRRRGGHRGDPHLRRHHPHAGGAAELPRRVPARLPAGREPRYNPAPVGLQYVDHCVGNVELGRMNTWVKFYEDVMGFRNLISFDDKDISTEYSLADVEGGRQRQRADQVPHQRAGAGQEEVADRRVPGVLPRARRAAHRASPPTTSSRR